MRLLSPRLPHLIALLTVALWTLAAAGGPVAAQQSLPAEFLGTWQGRADSSPFLSQVTIALSGGQMGEIVGTIDYPAVESRAVACGGAVQLQGFSGSQVTLIEKLTYGTAACYYADGTITLTLQSDGSLAYEWSHPNNPAILRGILTRTGGATASRDAEDAWCDQLVTTYAAAPTLSGPWRGPLEQRQGSLTWADGEVSVSDFVATAVVYNPTTSTTVPWDFGFAFRQTDDESAVQQVFIDSNGAWYYADYPYGVQASGDAPSYSFSPGLPNTLDLVVTGNTASFCLNGQFLSTVQLPPAVASDVYLVTGLFDETLVTGRILEYDRFAIWPVASTSEQILPQIACQWTGTWTTPYGELRLTQDGAGVTGDYDWDQGQISGFVSGPVLTGAWNEAPTRQPPADSGELGFTMAADCQSFTGQWRYGNAGEWRTGWSGQRLSG